MAKLLPIILLFIGIGVGAGAGIFLKPKPEECLEEPCPELATEHSEDDSEEESVEPNYIALKNQFVVPVIRKERVTSLVVLSLSLETRTDIIEIVFSREPKLRDAFLRVLFDHAHIGGFDGAFTESGRLEILRIALLESARTVIGDEALDILITDVVRQEV